MKKSTKILLLVIFLLILSFSIYFILNQNNTHSLAFVKKVNQYSKNQTNYSAVISKILTTQILSKILSLITVLKK